MQSKFHNSRKNNEELNLGICLQKPHASHYSNLTARIRSYSNWTKNSPRPVDLSEAGFYFTDTEDIVQCYYCGLKLKRWDVFDDPWVEHARHGKGCPHVANVKGHDFFKSLNDIDGDGPDSIGLNLYTDDLIFTTAAQALLGFHKEHDILLAIKQFVKENGSLEFDAMGIAKIIHENTHS